MNNFNKFTLTTAFFLSTLIPSKALAATLISDEVVGSSTPEVKNATSLQNGGFTITPNPYNSVLGNGSDEFTNWNFDFDTSSIEGTVTKALVDLDLTPSSLYETDKFSILGMGSVPFSDFLALGPVKSRNKQSFQIDLLNFFNPETILTAFNNSQGSLQATYDDDAIVSFAKLTLDVQPASVPEPTTTLGLLALVGLGSPLLKKRKS